MADVNHLKADVIANLDIRGFYEDRLQGQELKETSNGWSDRIYCPIHHDKNTPNFFVNLRDGSFKCHSCGANGSVFDFWIVTEGRSIEDKREFKNAIVALASLANIDVAKWEQIANKEPRAVGATPKKSGTARINKADANDASAVPIPLKEAQDLHAALRAEHIKYLNQKRGLQLQTIREHLIGWDDKAPVRTEDGTRSRGRFSIPVFDKNSKVRNVRLYSDRSPSEYKMLNKKGFGKPIRLYGLHDLLKHDWEHVCICEGEWDCLLLRQELKRFGLNTWGTITGTGGANTFQAEWLEYLQGRNIYFVYDCDEPGRTAAANHASRHFVGPMRAGKFKSVKLVELPLEGSKDMKDVTDYFIKAGLNIESFIKLVNETPELIVGGVTQDEATVEAIELDDLVTAIKDRRYIDKRVTVPITISGQSSRIYHAIRSYRVVKCPMRTKGRCCQEEGTENIIPYGHELFIQSCMCAKNKLHEEISRAACQEKQKVTIEPVKKVVMEEYFAHQVISRWRAEENAEGRMQNVQELTQTSVYILQPPDSVQIGPQNYMATGWIRSHPNTQIATFFVETLVPLDDDWKKFTLEREEHFSAIKEIKEDFTVDQIIEDITDGVTKIYEADDILYAVLLTYLSPLWINFNGDLMRGWINSAIIGDSGTGKSATYSRFADWLELGDLFSVLSGTRTGLLYAIKQRAGEWHVSIGRYVQSSGKIIAVDETQETTAEDIKRMAIAMDTGWLEVSQVASGGYPTQTRTLFLMNPKFGKTISDFAYGCEALRECFDPMFIRRLDVVVFTSGKHNYDFYNRLNTAPKRDSATRITARHMKALVYWAWTRKPSNIIWSEEATKICLQTASAVSEKFGYADDIPLVSPQDFRNNLARLATAYAILDRNFTPDLQSVTIEPRHVQAMTTFVDTVYSSVACNLLHRSKKSRRKNTLEDFDKIRENFQSLIDRSKASNEGPNHFCQLLLLLQQVDYIRKRDLSDQLQVTRPWLDRRLALLQAYNMVDIRRTGYHTTRKFNLFMQEWQQDPAVVDMLERVHEDIGKSALSGVGRNDETFSSYSPYNGDTASEETVDPF